MKYDYFEVPTQVKFWDYTNGRYHGGIAYKNEIICRCCGGAFNISKIYKLAPDTLLGGPIVVYDNWVCISYAICGDDN